MLNPCYAFGTKIDNPMTKELFSQYSYANVYKFRIENQEI